MSMYTNERDVIKVASFLVINVLMLTTTRLYSELYLLCLIILILLKQIDLVLVTYRHNCQSNLILIFCLIFNFLKLTLET